MERSFEDERGFELAESEEDALGGCGSEVRVYLWWIEEFEVLDTTMAEEGTEGYVEEESGAEVVG